MEWHWLYALIIALAGFSFGMDKSHNGWDWIGPTMMFLGGLYALIFSQFWWLAFVIWMVWLLKIMTR